MSEAQIIGGLLFIWITLFVWILAGEIRKLRKRIEELEKQAVAKK